MMSLSGTYAGINLAFEATTLEDNSFWRPWPAWHMQQGLWTSNFLCQNNSSPAFWMPANGANAVRVRAQTYVSGSALVSGLAMHAPASIGTGIVDKDDWSMVIQESPIGTSNVMLNHTTVSSTFLNVRTSTPTATSYTIPAGKRLRIHSYAGTFQAGGTPLKCLVNLRSNMAGASAVAAGTDVLAAWSLGPTAGGTSTDGIYSGLSSTLAEPIDIWSPTGTASVGISAIGGSTTGKLTFTLFGYLLG